MFSICIRINFIILSVYNFSSSTEVHLVIKENQGLGYYFQVLSKIVQWAINLHLNKYLLINHLGEFLIDLHIKWLMHWSSLVLRKMTRLVILFYLIWLSKMYYLYSLSNLEQVFWIISFHGVLSGVCPPKRISRLPHFHNVFASPYYNCMTIWKLISLVCWYTTDSDNYSLKNLEHFITQNLQN